MNDLESEYLRNRQQYCMWLHKSPELKEEQATIRDILTRHAGARHFGVNSFISRDAHVFTARFSIGDGSTIASGAILRESVVIGRYTSINPYCHIAGTVDIGNHVRIANDVTIMGVNHGHDRLDVPIAAQPLTRKGVKIEDHCWIGAKAVIVDGVTIGAHSIVAAGSVVTKSVPPYSVVGGNPARLIRSRQSEEASGEDGRPA